METMDCVVCGRGGYVGDGGGGVQVLRVSVNVSAIFLDVHGSSHSTSSNNTDNTTVTPKNNDHNNINRKKKEVEEGSSHVRPVNRLNPSKGFLIFF